MSQCFLYRLPNELFLNILKSFRTVDILPLTTISHRIYILVLRILHHRLRAVSHLQSHSILLECYHPSARLTEPPYFCRYLGTDGLEAQRESSQDDAAIYRRLGQLRGMYSRFQPYRRELEDGGRRVRRPGDIPGSRTHPGTTQDGFRGEAVKQILSLEAHQLFTQIVAQTHLARIGMINGMFLSFEELEEGVVRVWRSWLKESAYQADRKQRTRDPESAKLDAEDEAVLWVSPAKNTGLRLSVKNHDQRHDALILVRADEEDCMVSYEVQYKELFIRTTHLLLMYEDSLLQDDNSSGKAVVFGSFS